MHKRKLVAFSFNPVMSRHIVGICCSVLGFSVRLLTWNVLYHHETKGTKACQITRFTAQTDYALSLSQILQGFFEAD